MILITIDHNSDEITVTEKTSTTKQNSFNMKIKYTMEMQKFLIELLNLLNLDENIIIEEINEDNRRIVEEW